MRADLQLRVKAALMEALDSVAVAVADALGGSDMVRVAVRDVVGEQVSVKDRDSLLVALAERDMRRDSVAVAEYVAVRVPYLWRGAGQEAVKWGVIYPYGRGPGLERRGCVGPNTLCTKNDKISFCKFRLFPVDTSVWRSDTQKKFVYFF